MPPTPSSPGFFCGPLQLYLIHPRPRLCFLACFHLHLPCPCLLFFALFRLHDPRPRRCLRSPARPCLHYLALDVSFVLSLTGCLPSDGLGPFGRQPHCSCRGRSCIQLLRVFCPTFVGALLSGMNLLVVMFSFLMDPYASFPVAGYPKCVTF
jgi:hypothetical protein